MFEGITIKWLVFLVGVASCGFHYFLYEKLKRLIIADNKVLHEQSTNIQQNIQKITVFLNSK